MSKVQDSNAKFPKIGKVGILLIVWIFLFWICAFWAIWDGGYYLTTKSFTAPPRWKPLVDDIVGKWSLSNDSIRLVQDLGTEIPFHKIEFYADGTFKATNLPILLEWSDEKIVLGFYTGTGTWEFDKMRFKPWSIILHYDDYVEGLTTIPGYYFLQGKEPPYRMNDIPLVFERE